MSNVGRDAAREAKRAQVLYRHPRCVICSDPIVFKPGRNLRSRTCGKRSCVVARMNWNRPYAEDLRAPRTCDECHGPIPAERNANSIYCSRRCNVRRNGRITRMRHYRARRAA